MADLTDLQERIASVVDQSDAAPTAGDDTWDLRLKYLSRAQNKWSQSYDWNALYKEVNTLTSQATSNTSITMPSDYLKLAGEPKAATSGTNEQAYPQVDPKTREQYSASDVYCYELGNPKDGYTIVLQPGSLISGASIFYNYYAHAGTLASPADVSMCPDPEYLVSEAIAQLWEAREDPRYPEMKSEADRRLAQLIENENTPGKGFDNKASMPEDVKYGFRWGR